MAEMIDAQPSEGIATFQQAREVRADWAETTNLAWDGSRYYLMIVEKNTEYYAASEEDDVWECSDWVE